jgi:LacI family transcriptional regulator
VPDEISLIGYDDIDFAAAAAVPLSSIRQPRHALGVRAAELLFAEIEALETDAPHEHQHLEFAPDLVVRRSTMRPKKAPVVPGVKRYTNAAMKRR